VGRLQRQGVEAKFLYVPTGNHWVLNPARPDLVRDGDGFLDHHVLGKDWVRPELL